MARQLQQSHQLLKTSATLSDRNSIYEFFLSPSSLHLFRSHLDFFFRILIYISRYCLSRSCAVRENKTRTVKNLIFSKADSCWRGSIGGKPLKCVQLLHTSNPASIMPHHLETRLTWNLLNGASHPAHPLLRCLSTPLVSPSHLHCLRFFLLFCAAIHFVFIFFRSLFCRPQILISLSQSISTHKRAVSFCSWHFLSLNSPAEEQCCSDCSAKSSAERISRLVSSTRLSRFSCLFVFLARGWARIRNFSEGKFCMLRAPYALMCCQKACQKAYVTNLLTWTITFKAVTVGIQIICCSSAVFVLLCISLFFLYECWRLFSLYYLSILAMFVIEICSLSQPYWLMADNMYVHFYIYIAFTVI